jgi:imidazolonepropionase-like amidohydrolase
MNKMKNTSYIFTLALLFFIGVNHAQQTPANAQNKIISIVGATAHIGNGKTIENATLVFENGLITEIGNSDSVSAKGEIIDANNKHVYPGFILANSSLGLGEIDAVKATRDDDELGSLIPHVRSLIAYNAESKVIESVRPNGVLVAQITPRGGRISGTSSIVQLDAWNWEDAAIKVDDGIHANWPNSYNRKFFNRQIVSEPNKDYQKQINELKDFLLQAQTYSLSVPKKKNIPFDATKGIFSGEQKLYIHVKREKEIIDAVNFTIELGIPKVVLVGADEAYKVTDLLKKHNIPVLLKRVHTSPSGEDDDYDLPFKLASILVKKGILIALEDSGQMERMNSRNLPFYAGTTTGYGLNNEEALELITLNPAKILGIDDKYGSLEVGKSATLFISEGNALDMRTNIISKAFIDGRDISLETHQTKLFKRYMDKYESN